MPRRPFPIAAQWACYAALAALAAWVWWGRVQDLPLEYAAYGVSPMAFVYKQVEPENFAGDFPGGVELLGRSAPMLVYPLAYRLLGAAPERVYPLFVAFEIALMAWVMLLLTRTLRPEAPAAVGVLVAALVLASGARNMNFASFRQPFFWGLFYNVADGLRLLALVAALRGRALLAGGLLSGAFAAHPAMGLMGAAFVAAAFAGRKTPHSQRAEGTDSPAIACRVPRAACLQSGDGIEASSALAHRPRSWLKSAIGNWKLEIACLSGAAVFIGLAGLWTVCVLGVERVAGGEFPKSLWFGLTRMMSYHWYPVENGFFTTHHRAGFLPFLSFLILLGYYLRGAGGLGRRDRAAGWAMAAAMAMAVLGIAFSAIELSPALVKLALHRSNDLVATVGLVYVVAGLWGEMGSGRAWRGVVAALVLASPFLGPPGFPLAFSLVLAAPAWRGRRSLGSLLAMVLGAGSMVLLAAYAVGGLLGPLDSAAYAGWVWVRQPWVLGGLGAFCIALLVRRWAGVRRGTGISPGRSPFLPFLPLAAGLASAMAAAWVGRSRLAEGQVAWAHDYREVQRWARGNTPRDALFMLDPALGYPAFAYGWRDYARRGSFGVLREWLYTSWFYTSDYAACQEGVRRAGELGLDVREFLAVRPPSKGFAALALAARRAYYGASDEWRLDMARRYGIAYFVFEKQAGAPRSALPRAFENARFLVLASARPQE